MRHRNTLRIDPILWNKNHLAAVGATVRFGLELPTVTPPPDLLAAVVYASPRAPDFSPLHRDNELEYIARTSYDLTTVSPGPQGAEDRRYLCTEMIEKMFYYLCPCYNFPLYPLQLRYHDLAVRWEPRGLVGSHFWLVTPKRRAPDFAEEAAYVLSIAQEFMAEGEEDFDVWLVSMRAGHAAVIKATVASSLLDALEAHSAEIEAPVGPSGALRMEVSKEFRIADGSERVKFLEILVGLARMASAMRDSDDESVEAASW